MTYAMLAVGVLNVDTGATVLPTPLGNDAWSAYQAWLAAGNTPTPYVAPFPTPPSAAELAADAELSARAAIVSTLRANALVTALATRTPAQIDSWITANVTDLPSAINAIRLLAYVVALLARERLGQ